MRYPFCPLFWAEEYGLLRPAARSMAATVATSMAVLFFTTCKYKDFFPLQISGQKQSSPFAGRQAVVSAENAPPKACHGDVENRGKKFSTRCVKSLKKRRLSFNFPCRKYVKKYLKTISYSDFFSIFAVPKLRRSSPNQLILRDLGKFEIILKLYRDVTT
jgi:hypothetical protein